jgi:hypothetical protein
MENAALPTLKVEEGVVSLGMRVFSRSWKDKKQIFLKSSRMSAALASS